MTFYPTLLGALKPMPVVTLPVSTCNTARSRLRLLPHCEQVCNVVILMAGVQGMQGRWNGILVSIVFSLQLNMESVCALRFILRNPLPLETHRVRAAAQMGGTWPGKGWGRFGR